MVTCSYIKAVYETNLFAYDHIHLIAVLTCTLYFAAGVVPPFPLHTHTNSTTFTTTTQYDELITIYFTKLKLHTLRMYMHAQYTGLEYTCTAYFPRSSYIQCIWHHTNRGTAWRQITCMS